MKSFFGLTCWCRAQEQDDSKDSSLKACYPREMFVCMLVFCYDSFSLARIRIWPGLCGVPSRGRASSQSRPNSK